MADRNITDITQYAVERKRPGKITITQQETCVLLFTSARDFWGGSCPLDDIDPKGCQSCQQFENLWYSLFECLDLAYAQALVSQMTDHGIHTPCVEARKQL